MNRQKFTVLAVFSGLAMAVSAQDRLLHAPAVGQDSAVTVASGQYGAHSFLRRLFMGSNYRHIWQTPVKLPVFQLSGSGFTIKELGGGMQTKSLHLVDGQGRQWSLRTVDKDVSKALPPVVRKTVARRVSQDMVSAAHPYGAPVAGAVVNGAGVAAARPQVFVVADDPAFGQYRTLFAGTVCTLEEREPGYADSDGTVTLVENTTKDNRYRVAQHHYLRARLMDILLADWDRHADNWRWGQKDSAGLHLYYAIPRDRDWVFYQSKGLLPAVVQASRAMRCFVNFSPTAKEIRNLSWKAWNLDRHFLNELNAVDWETITKEVQASLTDSVLAAAVQTLPARVYAAEGEGMLTTLKQRRNDLLRGVMNYYRFQAEDVLVNGSDMNERFVFTMAGDGLLLTVYTQNGAIFYKRRFSPAETYRVTLNGRGGDDVFEMEPATRSKIRVVINGGEGADVYRLAGRVRTTVNDQSADSNPVTTSALTRLRLE